MKLPALCVTVSKGAWWKTTDWLIGRDSHWKTKNHQTVEHTHPCKIIQFSPKHLSMCVIWFTQRQPRNVCRASLAIRVFASARCRSNSWKQPRFPGLERLQFTQHATHDDSGMCSQSVKGTVSTVSTALTIG